MAHLSFDERKPISSVIFVRARTVSLLLVALAVGANACDGRRTNEEASRRWGDPPVPVGTGQSANARAIDPESAGTLGSSKQTVGTGGTGGTAGTGTTDAGLRGGGAGGQPSAR